MPFEHWLYTGRQHLGLAPPRLDDLLPQPPSRAVHPLVHVTSIQYLTKLIRLNGDETLEQAWHYADNPHEERLADTDETLSDALVQTAAKGELTNALSRLALAANLLLMVFGTRKFGHNNPAYGTP